MRPLTDCLPEFRLYCPNAPEPVALSLLRQSASHFCHKTRCWREVSTLAFINEPLRVAPTYQSLVQIDFAHHEGRPWDELTPIAYNDTIGEGASTSTLPSFITQKNTAELALHPFNERTVDSDPINITVGYWLKPNRVPAYGVDADLQNQLPDHVIEEHCDVIAQGALAKAFMLKDESLYNPDQAQVAATLYENGISDAKDMYARGQQRKPMRVSGQYM